jgi:voltage-gated potassium channel
MRSFVRNMFENPNARSFTIANDVLAITTLVSVVALVLETVASLHGYHRIFRAIEYVSVGVFTLEYVARLRISQRKLAYVFSFFGIIDLLSIIPTYLALGNLTFLKTSRALRILRFLRMLRLAKLARAYHKHKGARSLYFLNIQIYAFALFSALLVLGTLLFLFEHGQSYAKDIPSGMYWSFKVIFGGIPYEQPATTAGLFVLVACRFVSMILLGLMLSLIGTMTRKALTGSELDA